MKNFAQHCYEAQYNSLGERVTTNVHKQLLKNKKNGLTSFSRQSKNIKMTRTPNQFEFLQRRKNKNDFYYDNETYDRKYVSRSSKTR